MRKLLLSAILLSGALACHAQEQANIVATFYYDEGIPGIVWGISDNGQWAVGYDDMVAYNAYFSGNVQRGDIVPYIHNPQT